MVVGEPATLERSNKSMRSVAAVALALLVTTCTGETTEAPDPRVEARADPADPCALLSPEQVEAAIKTEVQDEQEVSATDGETRICSYKTGEPWASVGVSLVTNASADDFDESLRRDSLNTELVDDVGEGAFIHGCSSITVHASGHLVSASLQHLTTCDETNVVLTNLGRAIETSVRNS